MTADQELPRTEWVPGQLPLPVPEAVPPAGHLRDGIAAVIARRWATDGVDGVVDERALLDDLATHVVRALTEARADELEQAADHLLNRWGQRLAAQVLRDRATSLRASLRQTDERNDR